MTTDNKLQATIALPTQSVPALVEQLETALGNSSPDNSSLGDSLPSDSLPEDATPGQREEVRHILVGSPEAIRQVMHQLHVLNYAESLLWSPITTVGEVLTITREQGEAMSLLRRPI